jgi:hypothetical protein
MPRLADLDDEAWDEEEDDEGDDDDPTIPCPRCRREIYEDAERCPYCGSWVSREDARPARRPWWFIAGVIACFAVFYLWIFGL